MIYVITEKIMEKFGGMSKSSFEPIFLKGYGPWSAPLATKAPILLTLIV